ncbi:phage baseplate protein [Paenibacillus sp. Marseille-Q4541]|uniref:phage baseplate protein n=1 Tax=Paenibacillus sp. Marseille-Q4541 TaxID=2831522 RepID=UPI001BA8D8EA|nr:hypothetical protein [Paenibacillus sp. Marseille-Q4541]
MAKIDGKYYITVEEESPTFSAEITDQPVEKGANVSDHVQKGPASISVSGRIVGSKASEIRTYLKTAYEKGRVINYVGRNAFKGLISSFGTSHNSSIANGYTFSMEIREVIIVKTSSYSGQLPTPVRVQAKVINSAGTKQTKTKTGKTTTKSSAKKSTKTKTKKEKAKSKTKAKETVKKVTFKAGSKWEK